MQAPGENLLTRMWETIAEKGIGGLLKPWQMLREGRAAITVDRERLLAEAKLQIDIAELKVEAKFLEEFRQLRLLEHAGGERGRIAGALLLANKTDGATAQEQEGISLLEQVAFGQLKDAMRHEVNFVKVLAHTMADLANESAEPPEERVTDDWFFRWRSMAGEMTEEHMRAMWGRVLAEEIKLPGKISLRTLDALRVISREEAGWIEKIIPFLIGSNIFADLVSSYLDHSEKSSLHVDYQSIEEAIKNLCRLGFVTVNQGYRSNCPKDIYELLECANGQFSIIRRGGFYFETKCICYSLSQTCLEIASISSAEADLTWLQWAQRWSGGPEYILRRVKRSNAESKLWEEIHYVTSISPEVEDIAAIKNGQNKKRSLIEKLSTMRMEPLYFEEFSSGRARLIE